MKQLILSLTLVFYNLNLSSATVVSHSFVLGDTIKNELNPNTKWLYSKVSPSCQGYFTVERLRDTFIENREASLFAVFEDLVPKINTGIPLHYSNQKLYFHEEEAWHLFMDFDKNVGDTIEIIPSKNSKAYGSLDVSSFPELVVPFQFIISSIDSVKTTEDSYIKRFFGTIKIDDYITTETEIISQCGFVSSFMGQYIPWITKGCPVPRLRCFTNGVVTYSLFGLCGPSYTKEKEGFKVQLSPNPGDDFLKLVSNDPYSFSLSIYNTQGQQLNTYHNYISGQEINTSQLPVGMYIVRFFNSSGGLSLLKWVKN